jgi:hypothetical protein
VRHSTIHYDTIHKTNITRVLNEGSATSRQVISLGYRTTKGVRERNDREIIVRKGEIMSQDDLHRVRREPRFRPRSSRSPTTFTYASLWRSDFTVQERTDRYAKRGKGPRSEQEGRRRRVGRRTSRSARGDVWSPFPYVSARVFSFL